MAERVAGVDGVHVVTSSLARAKETGGAVADALGVRTTVDADWDEQAFGHWDGMSMRDLVTAFPEQLQQMRVEDDFSVEGGESHGQLAERVVAAFERAVELAGPGGTVVVATHRKPIMVVLQHVLGLTTERSWRLAAAPASLTGVEVWADGVMSVAFTNDTHHHGDA
ncbi:hypothetical protein GCM10025872_20610 [Barrientosiimonas endolithica]|uniref:Phosphoglycerate mutase n=1 Tax=Barrientosiimonas endolithica TaxID=1535208 RepID=A0ABM8HBV4_9MICO|nr:hypothetical protein GCM10025872_20610 [Barrientosiimonas endolithica]